MKLSDMFEKVEDASKDKKDVTKKPLSNFEKAKAAAKELDIARKELKKNPFESVVAEAKLEKAVEKFIDDNKLYHFEGDRGVGNLEKIVKEIGYEGHGFKHGTPIEAFLSDNPGAIEALLEWIKEQHVPEWAEALSGNDDEDEDEDLEESALVENRFDGSIAFEHAADTIDHSINTAIRELDSPAMSDWVDETSQNYEDVSSEYHTAVKAIRTANDAWATFYKKMIKVSG